MRDPRYCHSMSSLIAKLTSCGSSTYTKANDVTDTSDFYNACVNTPLVVGVDVGAAATPIPELDAWNNAIRWAEERETERIAAAELVNSWIEMEPVIAKLAADVVPEFAVGEILRAMGVAMTAVGGGGMVSKVMLIAAANKGVERVMSLREVFASEEAMSYEIDAAARAASAKELKAFLIAKGSR